MPPDLNDSNYRHWDQDELSEALAACADRWVPELFPAGKINHTTHELRVADISGRPPRNKGSCVIQLKGDHAGSYNDFGIGKGGGPLATVGDHFGLKQRELFLKAFDIVNQYGGYINGKSNGHASAKRSSSDDHLAAAAFALSHSVPAAGTLVETYFAARGLTLPQTEDLKFNGNLTYWPGNIGKPALVAVVRRPDGTPTGGIHRIYLKDDGSWHVAKRMLGPCNGGVVMLAPIGADGTLGIAEGIESATAAMQLTGVPCWSGLSAGNMRKMGAALALVKGLRRLIVFADIGPDGEGSAAQLRATVAAAGIQAEVCLPQGGDDFADDLAKGLGPPPAPPTPSAWPALPPKVITQFNQRYAVVNECGKAMVYERSRDPILNRNLLVRITFADFKKLYQNRFVDVVGQNGTHRKPAAEYWLSHSKRRQYLDGVVFDPTGNAPADCWNLWSGFAVEPKLGNWSLMRQHLFEVICSHNRDHFEYTLDWTALMFQHPERQGEVAISVKGQKGVGKGIWFQYLRKAWGQHGMFIANAKHLIGNFNGHLRDCIMLFADEAFFAGDRQHESVLKAIVTEPILAIEAKNQNLVNVKNMLHVGMASNSDWIVPASHDERRYFVLNASDHRTGQLKYFTAIAAQMDNGGLAAMIYDMLHRDISSFNVRDVPVTDALIEQKKHSLDTVDKWWLAVLERGFVWRSRHGLTAFAEWNADGFYSTELLHRSYLQWCGDNRVPRPMTRVELGTRMTSMYRRKRPDGDGIIGEVENATPGWLERNLVVKKSRPSGYQVDTLDEARAQFWNIRGVPGDWRGEP
jgi:Family of unknown function (DUF5906)/Toprim domain